MDVAQMNRNKTKCYWESQPTGCKKPHCPFLHDKPKDPYPEAVTQILENPAPPQNIIVNRNKIAELSGLILPVKPGLTTAAIRTTTNPEDSAVAGRRVTVPQRSVKARLRTRRIAAKERLGERRDINVEVFECSEEEEEGEDEPLNSEEEALRSSAMKTLDLRNRLTSRRVREVDSGDELADEEISADDMEPGETGGLKSTVVVQPKQTRPSIIEETEELESKVVKKSKKVKKERKIKDKKAIKKAKRAEKKMRKEKRSSINLGARALLSIKEEAEKLVKSKKLTDKDESGEEEVKSILLGKQNLENIKIRVDVKGDSPSPSPSPPPPSSRKRKKRADAGVEVSKSKILKKTAKAKKRKSSEKLTKSEKKVKKKEAVEAEIDEIDQLLNEEAEDSTTAAKTTTEAGKSNDATDVIKEMDDILNDA